MTPRARELLNDTLAILATHGFKPTVDNKGRHVKVRWNDAGRPFLFILPQSPSDPRARLNSRAVLRRLLRGRLNPNK